MSEYPSQLHIEKTKFRKYTCSIIFMVFHNAKSIAQSHKYDVVSQPNIMMEFVGPYKVVYASERSCIWKFVICLIGVIVNNIQNYLQLTGQAQYWVFYSQLTENHYIEYNTAWKLHHTSIPAWWSALTIFLNSKDAAIGPPPLLAYLVIGAKKFIVEYPHVLIWKRTNMKPKTSLRISVLACIGNGWKSCSENSCHL